MGGIILLADDSLTIQKVVELTFSDTEFTVIAVSTGDELLQRLPSARPDVIICDVIMPGRDGYDVCQQIKSNPTTLQIPVVLLTGTFEPFDRDRALAAGCSEIISKPFEARKLVETVDRLVQHAHSARPADLPPPPVEGAIRPPSVERPTYAPPPMPEGLPPAPPTWPAPPPPAAVEAETAFEPFAPGAEPVEEVAHAAEEELDFTASGFAEMEAAGREAAVERMEAPHEGLDFEHEPLPVDVSETGAPLEPASEEPVPQESPWADRTWDKEEPAAAEPPDDSWIERPEEVVETGATEPTHEADEEPFGEPEGIILQPWQETPPAGEPSVSETTPSGLEPLSLADEVTPAEPFSPDTAPERAAPFHTMPMARLDDLLEAAKAMDEEATVEEPSGPTGEPVEEAYLHAPFEADEVPADAPAEPFPAAVAAAEQVPFAEEADEPEPAEAPGSETRADTQPTVVVPPSTAQLRLSDEDVERVAKRVLELSRGLVEQIAWDVLPDMAEIVVRERVREIEAEADRESDTSTH